MAVEIQHGGGSLQLPALTIDQAQQRLSGRQAGRAKPLRQSEVWGLEFQRRSALAPANEMELVVRIGSVGLGVEGRRFDEPGVAPASHLAAKLSGNDSPRAVDQSLGKHDRWRKIVIPPGN